MVKYETENHSRIDRAEPSDLTGEFEPLRKYVRLYQEAQKIHGSYNYNGSDSRVDYFHVRYYGHVEFVNQTRYDNYIK